MMFKGFTLAEVLITLGIIGVVAAVTLPSLQVNVNKQALSTQIAKTYSQLTHAVQLYMQNEGLEELDPNNFFNKDALSNFAKNYLQIQYVCTTADPQCFADKYTGINDNTNQELTSLGRTSNIWGFSGILKDGTHLSIVGGEGIPNTIEFDVNGTKGPNKVGYDYFNIYMNPDGSIGRSISDIFDDPDKLAAKNEEAFTKCKNLKEGYPLGNGCFIHLQQNNFKFDY